MIIKVKEQLINLDGWRRIYIEWVNKVPLYKEAGRRHLVFIRCQYADGSENTLNPDGVEVYTPMFHGPEAHGKRLQQAIESASQVVGQIERALARGRVKSMVVELEDLK